jgi:uncharacterized membrane protein YbhN (UPF0104 family)
MSRNLVRWLVKIAVAAALFAVLALVVDPSDVIARLRTLDPLWVLPALGVTVVQVLVSAWRWRFTARRLDVPLPLSAAVTEYYLATFINQVLPGGVLGDVSRAWRHARSSGVPSVELEGGTSAGLRSVHAVVLERLSGQVVMTGVAALSAVALLGVTAVVALVFALVAGAAVLRGAQRFTRRPGSRTLMASARQALLGPSVLPVQLGSSLVVVLSYLAVFLMAARAVGVDTPTVVLLPLLAPVLVTMLLPVTIAGWGLREGAAAALWSAVGLPASDGVAMSMAYGLLVLVSSLPGAAIIVFTLWRDRAPDRTARPVRGESVGQAGESRRPASPPPAE